MKIKIHTKFKSIPSSVEFEVPKFCVITGINGSGKSHLLEAIANKNFSTVSIDGSEILEKLHIGYNQLDPKIDEQFEQSQISGIIDDWHMQISDIGQNFKTNYTHEEYSPAALKELLDRDHANQKVNAVVMKLLEQTGKYPHELTNSDLLSNISFVDIANNTLFFTQFAMIFKTYHTRKLKNTIAEYESSMPEGVQRPFLSSIDFINKYGPPPWELVNNILARANLPYELPPPELSEFELPFRLTLRDKNNGVDITIRDLSSGEKVLMSLALAIYNTNAGGILPKVLLLDEPDAPLHPQFSKLLIEILNDVIVEQAGINVIITTHSPSTVALAPENSVFEINKTSRTPYMVSNTEAVRILTHGVDYLRVSIENRRQVFVEHKFDVLYFDKLFNACSRTHKFTYQPIFLEPHSGTSNCTDVKTLVKNLRNAGNDLVWGIIDFDLKNKPTESITILGDGARYAIENYLLDPLFVCLSLIRNNKKSYSDFGVSEKITYLDAVTLSELDCQQIINSFLTQIGIPLDDLELVHLENGFKLNYPKAYLFHQGHEYETRIKETFVELKAISRGNGDSALKLGVMDAITDFPQFLPVEIKKTFETILELKA